MDNAPRTTAQGRHLGFLRDRRAAYAKSPYLIIPISTLPFPYLIPFFFHSYGILVFRYYYPMIPLGRRYGLAGLFYFALLAGWSCCVGMKLGKLEVWLAGLRWGLRLLLKVSCELFDDVDNEKKRNRKHRDIVVVVAAAYVFMGND
ncbi:hypothetical protein F5X96DRAFT_452646 [Biscogniauxia mediterranea]|nr:hypothetical protein F5X96DRAFT_452646 [Biscogniauxia mediterranea]